MRAGTKSLVADGWLLPSAAEFIHKRPDRAWGEPRFRWGIAGRWLRSLDEWRRHRPRAIRLDRVHVRSQGRLADTLHSREGGTRLADPHASYARFPPDIRVENEVASLLDAGHDVHLLCPKTLGLTEVPESLGDLVFTPSSLGRPSLAGDVTSRTSLCCGSTMPAGHVRFVSSVARSVHSTPSMCTICPS